MDVFFLFLLLILPLTSVGVSCYCLYRLVSMKKVVLKAAARCRIAGEDSFL